jgi:hypothetical protein
MLFEHVISTTLNIRAPTIDLRAICWALTMDLEHVKQWKERIILAWGRWQQQVGNTKVRKPSSRFGNGTTIQLAKKRQAPSGCPIVKIFQQEKQEEVDLTIRIFFHLNFISFNVAQSPLFIEICRAPIRYVPPNS